MDFFFFETCFVMRRDSKERLCLKGVKQYTPSVQSRGFAPSFFSFFSFLFFNFHLFHFFLTVICLSAELHDNDRTLRLRPTLRSSTEATIPQCGFAPQQVAIRGFAPALPNFIRRTSSADTYEALPRSYRILFGGLPARRLELSLGLRPPNQPQKRNEALPRPNEFYPEDF